MPNGASCPTARNCRATDSRRLRYQAACAADPHSGRWLSAWFTPPYPRHAAERRREAREPFPSSARDEVRMADPARSRSSPSGRSLRKNITLPKTRDTLVSSEGRILASEAAHSRSRRPGGQSRSVTSRRSDPDARPQGPRPNPGTPAPEQLSRRLDPGARPQGPRPTPGSPAPEQLSRCQPEVGPERPHQASPPALRLLSPREAKLASRASSAAGEGGAQRQEGCLCPARTLAALLPAKPAVGLDSRRTPLFHSPFSVNEQGVGGRFFIPPLHTETGVGG